MLTRIRPRPLVELARRDLPGPVDVINLITPSRMQSYRWYGLLVMPALTLVGGQVLWMGRFERSVAGERQADKFFVVRYPSHRHFLAMTLNPYYLAINRFREAGVRRFEASFTHASHTDPELPRRRELVAVHFNSRPGEDALQSVVEAAGPVGELVYATRAVASLGFLDPPADTDPNPLTFGEVALFAPDGDLEAGALETLAARLDELTDGHSLQVYRREPRSAYRPSLRSRRVAPEAASA
jgi:uncharacterized protein (DUF1330 family)